MFLNFFFLGGGGGGGGGDWGRFFGVISLFWSRQELPLDQIGDLPDFDFF